MNRVSIISIDGGYPNEGLIFEESEAGLNSWYAVVTGIHTIGTKVDVVAFSSDSIRFGRALVVGSDFEFGDIVRTVSHLTGNGPLFRWDYSELNLFLKKRKEES